VPNVIAGERQVKVVSGPAVTKVVVTEVGASKVINSEMGPRGHSAKVSLGFTAHGPYSPRGLIAPIIVSGDGVLDENASKAEAFEPCAAPTVWYVTKNGTFVSPITATAQEITDNLFATITFPAGAGRAVFDYVTGGIVEDDDVLRVWGDAVPDATQGLTSVTLASI